MHGHMNVKEKTPRSFYLGVKSGLNSMDTWNFIIIFSMLINEMTLCTLILLVPTNWLQQELLRLAFLWV